MMLARMALSVTIVTVSCVRRDEHAARRTIATNIRVPCRETAEATMASPQRVPFGLFSPAAADIAALAGSGFTMVGPWYEPARARAALDEAEKAGLAVVYPIGYPHDRYRERHVVEWSADETRTEIGAQVDALAGHATIAAWFLLPEELHDDDAHELEYLRVAAETIHERDPLHRPVLSYQANHRDADRLAPVLTHVDIAMKGAYANFAGNRDARAYVRWSIDELEAASGKPAWLVPEMFQDPPDADVADIATWVRHDVYAGLVAGARGVLVFSGWRRPNFARFDDYLHAYEVVADELNGSLGLGDVLLTGRTCHGEPIEIVEGSSEVDVTAARATHRLPALGRLDVEHRGVRWSFLVNSSSERLVLRAPWFSDDEIVVGSRERVDDGTIALPAWGVAVLRTR